MLFFLWKHKTKARFETVQFNCLITSLCIEYIGEFMTLNQKVLTSLQMIEFHFMHWEVQVFYLMYSKSHFNSVKFSFCVSVDLTPAPHPQYNIDVYTISKLILFVCIPSTWYSSKYNSIVTYLW